MELRDISIGSGASEDAVQFIKHLEENLDPSGEFDCQVWLETVHIDEVGELPGGDIPMRGPKPEPEEYGVHLYVEFGENSECPNHEFNRLVRSFFGEDFRINAGFDGGMGEYNGYVFPTKG